MPKTLITWNELRAELDRNLVTYSGPASNRTSGWTVTICGSGTIDPHTGAQRQGRNVELVSEAYGQQADASSHAKFKIEWVYEAFGEAAIAPTHQFTSDHPRY